MANIFQHLNELNTWMQGYNENLLTSKEKINGFCSKVKLQQEHMINKNLKMFLLSKNCQRKMNTDSLCKTVTKTFDYPCRKIIFLLSFNCHKLP